MYIKLINVLYSFSIDQYYPSVSIETRFSRAQRIIINLMHSDKCKLSILKQRIIFLPSHVRAHINQTEQLFLLGSPCLAIFPLETWNNSLHSTFQQHYMYSILSVGLIIETT